MDESKPKKTYLRILSQHLFSLYFSLFLSSFPLSAELGEGLSSESTSSQGTADLPSQAAPQPSHRPCWASGADGSSHGGLTGSKV